MLARSLWKLCDSPEELWESSVRDGGTGCFVAHSFPVSALEGHQNKQYCFVFFQFVYWDQKILADSVHIIPFQAIFVGLQD